MPASFQALGDLTSPRSGPDFRMSFRSRIILGAKRYLKRISQTLFVSVTLPDLIQNPMPDKLTSLLVDFPASRFPSPMEIKRGKQITVTSGRKCLESYKKSDHDLSLPKMFLESFAWHSTRCSLIWKVSDTPHGHLLFRLVPKMHLTAETGYGLLPVRSTSRRTLKGETPLKRTKLPETQRIWFFPTPLATDANNANLPPSQIKRGGIVGELLRAGVTGRINPEYIEWLMGYPIGWTELED